MKIFIDAQKKIGRYVDPTSWQNTTLRYSPPKDFPEYLAEKLGRAKIMRVFITLDEYWDYRTDRCYPDYAIGVKRYPDSKLHYIYDWKMIVPAPSGTRFEDYLTSHAQQADELMLNVRRLEREVSDGVITYEQYEAIFEKAVDYCKTLAPNIRYIECCNEVDLKTFGDLTPEEYLKIYVRAFRVIKRLNQKHGYPVPLEIGGWSLAKPFISFDMWKEFLKLLSEAGLGERPIDFYSVHYYHEACSEGMERRNMDGEARALCAIDRFKLWLKRHDETVRSLGLPECPVFCNEIGKERPTGDPADALKNAAGVLTYLIAFSDPALDRFYMFPWCTFHNPELQISYTQFLLNADGGYSATPNGMALLMLHKMCGERVYTDVSECDAPDAPYRAQTVMGQDRLWVVCANPEQTGDVFRIRIDHLAGGNYEIREYLCDSIHNNCITGTGSGEPEVTNTTSMTSDGCLELSVDAEANSFVLLEISGDNTGTIL